MKSFTIKQNDAAQRLDKFITKAVPLLPQGLMYKYIRIKRIKVNGKRAEISTRLNIGDTVDMYINDEFFEKKETVYDFMSASNKIDIVYEDEYIIVINKPKGMVVHPAAGNPDGTLVNALLYHCKDSLSGIGGVMRPGIVHRIDKDTSGLLVVAKNDLAHTELSNQLKDKTVIIIEEVMKIGSLASLIMQYNFEYGIGHAVLMFDQCFHPLFFPQKVQCHNPLCFPLFLPIGLVFSFQFLVSKAFMNMIVDYSD